MDEISTLPHIEWPTTSRNWLERANSGRRGWVDVARHHREQVDVFGAEGADQSVSPMAISSNVRFWMKS
jgi:hypothetical protein